VFEYLRNEQAGFAANFFDNIIGQKSKLRLKSIRRLPSAAPIKQEQRPFFFFSYEGLPVCAVGSQRE